MTNLYRDFILYQLIIWGKIVATWTYPEILRMQEKLWKGKIIKKNARTWKMIQRRRVWNKIVTV